MTLDEAKKLKPGDRVWWSWNLMMRGTVTECRSDHTIIHWDDGPRTHHPTRGVTTAWREIERLPNVD